MKKQLISIIIIFLFCVLFLSCSPGKNLMGGKIIYIYNCNDVKLIYNPIDSMKTYIYPHFYNSRGKCDICPFYEDSSIVKLFENGYITSKILWKSKADNNSWYEFDITENDLINIKVDSCFSVIPDSNNTVIELMQVRIENDNKGNKYYSFQITNGYGTDNFCYELKKVDDKKYFIRSVGIIF